MDISFRAAAADADFEQILALQRKNLYTIISQEVQDKEGFVFAEHNIEILKTMSAHLPQTIAIVNEKIIGYTLAMTSSMTHHLPSLTPMFEQFDKCVYKNQPLLSYPFVVGGQVCVAEGYRGLGVVSGLYNGLANQVKGEYKLCVTEIARRNPRSLKAHQKIGFEVIRSYPAQNEIWDVVVWDMLSGPFV